MGYVAIELDKQLTADLTPSTWGSIDVRLLVLKPKRDSQQNNLEIEDVDDEPDLEVGKGPLDSYLERPKGGKGYLVLLLNGQRHDQMDEWFVGRDLGFKYLRPRTMIVVDVDGLAPEAIGQLVQGSRQGFYKGEVYHAIFRRLISILKADPDLKRLEADAEQEISELRSGDEAVRSKLDQLIEGHHLAAARENDGSAAPGTANQQAQLGNSVVERDFVIQATPDIGLEASGPVLVADHTAKVIRLHPDETKVLHVESLPTEDWRNILNHRLSITPEVSELTAKAQSTDSGLNITLQFREPDDFPLEDYPVISTLTVSARFDGEVEPRLLEKELIITPKKPRLPRPAPTLRSQPTFLRVVSRQPVQLIPGGPATHVRLRWDGEDELAKGWPPKWTFKAKCLNLNSFPEPVFVHPRDGSFEVLVDTPEGFLPGQKLDFQIEARGPNGAMLATPFTALVAEMPAEPEPRKVMASVPEGGAQRKPPYDIRVITEAEWSKTPCWSESEWTEDDAGCFYEPTQSAPLILVINQDAKLFKAATEEMLNRKLEDRTIKERTARYQTHIAFHLWQMYLDVRNAKDRPSTEDSAEPLNEGYMRAEINRVAGTLSKLMS